MAELLSKEAGSRPARHLAGNLPQKIALGALLGIATGIVFGERTTVLQPIGDAYGAMLQIARVPETLRVREHIQLFRSYYPAPLPMNQILATAGILLCLYLAVALPQRRGAGGQLGECLPFAQVSKDQQGLAAGVQPCASTSRSPGGGGG